jgi:hypothetical protein
MGAGVEERIRNDVVSWQQGRVSIANECCVWYSQLGPNGRGEGNQASRAVFGHVSSAGIHAHGPASWNMKMQWGRV